MTTRSPSDLDQVRRSYDAVADRYVDLLDSEGMGDLRRQPWLRCAVDRFVEAAHGHGPVLDAGCGPGQVTAYLAEQGLETFGVDLSPRMVMHARRRHPGCRFEVGSLTDLELRPSSLGGVLAWWSLFNLPRDLVPEVVASFRHALVPGAPLLLATHAGEGDVRRTDAYGGIPVSWTTHRWHAERLVEVLEEAGLSVVADLRLGAGADHGAAVVLLARRPDRSTPALR